jgi:ATP-dependent helicase HrpB
MTELPIYAISGEIITHLSQHPRLVVQAPPGAGKSTGLPLALLNAHPNQTGQIWLLEPRRLAAEQVASRLAQGLGEEVGASIGLMTGENTRVSDQNRLVVMTEAVLTQRLITDNDIPSCRTILFDEFHERNLHTDLGLALALQCQTYLRDDLKIVIMSATLDSEGIAQTLDCPTITSDGRSFDVVIKYLPSNPQQTNSLALDVKRAVSLALEASSGDILVFLPGVKEINQCLAALNDTYGQAIDNQQLSIEPLHGQQNPQQQNAVLKAKNIQCIILATDIAKTSLTLPKVTCVIDSGLERINQFNLRQGMDELVTIKASQASAIQRAGRAGRVQAGTCYRLYSEDDFKRRPPFSPHAIERADLAPLCLNLAAWGSLDVNDYVFLTPPDPKGFNSSQDLLQQLNILTHAKLTQHGARLAKLALHPRLSHMIVKAQKMDMGYDACVLAAILSEGDPLYFQEQNADLNLRLQLFERTSFPSFFENAKVNQKKAQRILKLANKFAKMLGINVQRVDSQNGGTLVMLAYPDRIAQKRGNGYRLRNGLGCQRHHLEHLAASDFLAIAHISQSQQQGQHANSIIRLACPVSKDEIEALFADQLSPTHTLKLNDKQQLQTITQLKLGELVLNETLQPAGDSEKNAFYLQEFEKKGLDFLPLNDSHQQTLKRLQLANKILPDRFLSFDETDLIQDKDNWLAPFLETTALKSIDYSQALLSRLDWDVQQQLNPLFPTSFELPTGRKASIDYSETPPVVKAKLQECFGLAKSPTIAQEKVTLNLHLLSPAQRPLAMTQDLAFFWKEAYPQVRKENRGRYAKHPWPEDPLTAEASGLTKKRMSQQ